MQANRRVSAPRRDLPAASIACRARYARLTVAKDAEEGDCTTKTAANEFEYINQVNGVIIVFKYFGDKNKCALLTAY
jgi:hypothetical protein